MNTPLPTEPATPKALKCGHVQFGNDLDEAGKALIALAVDLFEVVLIVGLAFASLYVLAALAIPYILRSG